MKLTRLNVSLERLEIGVSGAVPDRQDWSEPAMDRGVLEFVALFSGLVLKYGGRIVHGSHPTFTPVILHQARQHARERSRKPVTLVMSDLWARAIPESELTSNADVAELIVTKAVGEGGPDNSKTRNASLSAMRQVLIRTQNAMVAVGGKMHAGDNKVPGVDEEMKLAENWSIPRFLVGGLGGFSAQLASKLMPRSLRNGLSEEQNLSLFSSNDVAAAVNVLFEHLANIESSPLPIRQTAWDPRLRSIMSGDEVDAATTALISRVI